MLQLYLYLACLGISTILNLGLWRKFFNETYNFDEDLYFAQYITRYPRTAKFLLFLSYFVAFQTIRLTYSRLLGKK